MIKDCYRVICTNYSDGKDAFAFMDETDARKSVDENVETVLNELTEQGYEPVILRPDSDSVEMYVADSDIYYEWQIVLSTIRGGESDAGTV